MKCTDCGGELFGIVTVQRAVPVAQKGGSLNMKGVRIKAKEDIKDPWDSENIRGPIVCGDCGASYYYVKAGSPTLRKGDVHEAREIGYEKLVEGDLGKE